MTHHEIIEQVAPFTRAGHRLDLAASDRLQRRLVFKPVEHGASLPGLTGLVDALALHAPVAGHQRLTRTLTLPSGLQAVLTADGPDASALLATVDATDPSAQFRHGPSYHIALSHRLDAGREPLLVGADAALDGLQMRMQMQVSAVKGIPAVLTLVKPPGSSGAGTGAGARAATATVRTLPQDLLAVLGLHWSRLSRTTSGWRATVSLQGRGASRSEHAVRQIEAGAAHLAATLGQPPQAFHERHRVARWVVTLRQGVPLAVCLGIIGAALAVPALDLGQDSVFRMLIFNAPPLLLAAFFAFREMPRIELPPLPRRLGADAWQPARPTAPEADGRPTAAVDAVNGASSP